MLSYRRLAGTIGLLLVAALVAWMLGLCLRSTIADVCYGMARGRRDQDTAFVARLHRYACDLGQPRACLALGQIGARGRVRAVDARLTERAYQKACELGELDGCLALAGRGTDAAESAALYARACRRGRAEACWELQKIYAGAARLTPESGDGLAALEEGCRANRRCCQPLSRLYLAHPEVDPDGTQTVNALQRSCDVNAWRVQNAERSEAEYCLELARRLEGRREPGREGRRAASALETACQVAPGPGCAALGDHLMAHPKLDPDHERARSAYAEACRDVNGEACTELVKLLMATGDLDDPSSASLRTLRRVCEARREACGRLWEALPEGRRRGGVPFETLETFKQDCSRPDDTRSCSKLVGLYGQTPMGEAERLRAVAYIESGCRELDGTHRPYCECLENHARELIAAYSSGCPDPSCRGAHRVASLLRREAAVCARVPEGCQPVQAVIHGLTVFCDSIGDWRASEKDADACLALGTLHRDGLFVPQDADGAAQLLGQACGKGRGCYALGTAHLTGLGLTRDRARAVGAYLIGCEGTDARACEALLRLRREGKLEPGEWQSTRATLESQCERQDPFCERAALLSEREGGREGVAWATTLRDKACEAGDSAACFTLARERYEAETRRAAREAAAGPRLTIRLLHQQQAHDESARKSTQWSASTLWSTTGSAPGPQSLPIAGDVDIALSAIYFLVEGCPQCALELEVVRRLEPGGSIEESTLVIRGFTRTLRSAPIRFSGNGLQRLSLAEDSQHPVGAAVLRGKEVDRFLSAAKTQVGSSALYSSICSPPEDWLPAEAGDGDASESALRRRLSLETERRLRECVHRDPSLLNGLFTITRIEVHGRWQDGQGQSRALPTLVHEYSGETD